jgi:hypothetical protein
MSSLPKTNVPENARSVAIFDTNAYRNLTFGLSLADAKSKAIHVRQREESLGILSLASPIVIWELSSHLADAADPAYHHCLNAMAALGEHARSTDVSAPGIRLASDSEWVVCDVLFSRAPPGAVENVANLSALANYIRDNAPSLSDPVVLSNINKFAKEMAARETVWLGDLQKLLDHLNSLKTKTERRQLRAALESTPFAELWSVVAVSHYADLVSVALDASELDKRAQFFRAHFAGAFHVILALLRNLLGSPGLNLTSARKKRGNFMWDAGIAYLIPTSPAAADPAVEIVSGDKALIEAAAAAGHSKAVTPLDQYCKRIGV